MADTPRFQCTGKGSFFGDYVYRQVVDRRHFLVALNELVDWSALGAHLLDAYKGRGRRGRPPYDPVLTLKMLFIRYLYGVSERQVEELSTYHLAVKYFRTATARRRVVPRGTPTLRWSTRARARWWSRTGRAASG